MDRVEAAAPAEIRDEVLAYRDGVLRYLRLLTDPGASEADVRAAQAEQERAGVAVIDYIDEVC